MTIYCGLICGPAMLLLMMLGSRTWAIVKGGSKFLACHSLWFVWVTLVTMKKDDHDDKKRNGREKRDTAAKILKLVQ